MNGLIRPQRVTIESIEAIETAKTGKSLENRTKLGYCEILKSDRRED